MKTRSSRTESAFTIIELLVVAVIIALVATLILPALQGAQQRSLAVRCGGNARNIATALVTYAAEWRGYTNSDADHYTKLLLSDLRGIQPSQLASVTRFVCPADGTRKLNTLGVPSSYTVLQTFAGENILKINTPKKDTPVLFENAKRHLKFEGVSEELDRMYAFQDLHFQVGFVGAYKSGLDVKVWSNVLAYIPVSGAELNYPIAANYEKKWLSQFDINNASFWNNLMDGGGNPNRFTTRFDGFLEAPVSGTYQFKGKWDDRMWMWLDSNSNEEVEGAETYSRNWWTGGSYTSIPKTWTLAAGTKYRFVVTHENFQGTVSLGFKWRTAGLTEEILQSDNLFESTSQ
ncbi:MAG: PA14 domain-containing protein [Planctomycetota bacterium]|jgi:type II secretory pathway pseudopilin PulG|nr:PA14 domain-containing protein [Planctomycetota bacterium]